MGLTGTEKDKCPPFNRITYSVDLHLTGAISKQVERVCITDSQMLIAAAVVHIRHDCADIRSHFR
ncbi:hypothetical protein D3C71_1276190 [compost metagenome]